MRFIQTQSGRLINLESIKFVYCSHDTEEIIINTGGEDSPNGDSWILCGCPSEYLLDNNYVRPSEEDWEFALYLLFCNLVGFTDHKVMNFEVIEDILNDSLRLNIETSGEV